MRNIFFTAILVILTLSVDAQTPKVQGNFEKVVTTIVNNMTTGFDSIITKTNNVFKLKSGFVNEPTIANVKIVYEKNGEKGAYTITINFKPTNSAKTVVLQQEKLLKSLDKVLVTFKQDFVQNRLVSFIENGDPRAAYDAVYENESNSSCYVRCSVDSDYSNRSKPMFNNTITFFSCK